MLDFGREICCDLAAAEAREWLVTNGIGGYAMGTVAGILTRAYHGLLIAALAPPFAPGQPPAARTLLLAKLDETARHGSDALPLYANRQADEPRAGLHDTWVTPKGFRRLERFHLEGTIPVWTFALGGTLLEKRVWMQPGANTTYIHYRLARGGNDPLDLHLEALVNCRDHHGNTPGPEAWPMKATPVAHGLRLEGAYEGFPPLYLLSRDAHAAPEHGWREGFYLRAEHYRGLADREAHLHAADFNARLELGTSLTIVASTELSPSLDGDGAYAERRAYEQDLLRRFHQVASLPSPADVSTDEERAVEHLVLAADQFIVARRLPDGSDGSSVIAGYPWFGDWGRDTMIGLPGLTLATGRFGVARRILESFAQFVDQGMLPNRFPDAGETPEYNTVDATLWYVEAIRAYHATTGDDGLLRTLYPVLREVIDWHRRGTRYNIHVDPEDGLLYGGVPGVQLTWMDAKVDGWVVTPRIGKPVEVNALWYNALRAMEGFARLLDRPEEAGGYQALAERVHASFDRFWSEALGYCLDVLDGPAGPEASLRPNQLFAVSLHHSPLDDARARAVLDACARSLLTSHGLRSLAGSGYVGRYGGDRRTRDAAYHQGTVWGWLMGPFVSAVLRVHGDPELARSFLQPLLRQLDSHGVGSLSEIFDGDPPHTPRGCIAQAWTVAEVLRAWQLLARAERSGD
jgi:predicted glycogen debranching enzyme